MYKYERKRKGWKKNHKEGKKIWSVVKRTISQSPKKRATILVAQKRATKVNQVVASKKGDQDAWSLELGLEDLN